MEKNNVNKYCQDKQHKWCRNKNILATNEPTDIVFIKALHHRCAKHYKIIKLLIIKSDL